MTRQSHACPGYAIRSEKVTMPTRRKLAVISLSENFVKIRRNFLITKPPEVRSS